MIYKVLKKELEEITKAYSDALVVPRFPPLTSRGERKDDNMVIVDYMDIMSMDRMSDSVKKMERKQELEQRIAKLQEDYWDGNCTPPDSVYDALVEELRAIDPNNPLVTSIEHGEIKGSKKIYHAVPMLSLLKVYNFEALLKWVFSVSRSDDEKFLVQPKYDGISCHFDHGVYSTRGDGHVGEDITSVCQLLCKHDMEEGKGWKDDFLGEIVIRNSDFNGVYRGIRRPNGDTFKTQRNAVAGIVNNDDPKYYADQNAVLTLVDYEKNSFVLTKADFELKWEIVKKYLMNLDYPMDGIVVKIADPKWREEQGYTDKTPKGAIAFKFENSSAVTKLKTIDWGMGKEYITATAVFEPIVLNGVTISRAVIPMKSQSLPCVMDGDFTVDAKLKVERAGDVIPHITEVESDPTCEPIRIYECPFCHSEIEVLDSGVRCKNDKCWRKRIHRLYAALVVLGIKNVGENTVMAICQNLTDVTNVDLCWWMENIPKLEMEIASLPDFGDASAKQVLAETEKIVDTDIEKFIAALGIPNVGRSIGYMIGKRFDGIGDFLDTASIDKLSSLDGIGEVMAHRIMNWLATNDRRSFVNKLSSMFRFKDSGQAKTEGGVCKTVCFTGAMRMKRSEMERVASESGYKPVDGVTKTLDLLVVADDADMSGKGKFSKAEKYGVQIVTETNFLKMCGK